MRSMTGYGRGTYTDDGREMSVEVRTVNHRFLDVSVRLPRQISFLENAVRKMISERLKRGHADVAVSYRNTRADAHRVEVDESLAGAYLEGLRAFGEKTGVRDDLTLSVVASFADVVQRRDAEEDEETLLNLLRQAAHLALDGVVQMREREGQELLEDLKGSLGRAEEKTRQIALLAAQMPLGRYERLKQRLEELRIDGADPQRLLQEAALLSDRCSVDEELARLASHYQQLHDVMGMSEEIGRKMDFLVQELNREVNTIASKSIDVQLTALAVDIKCEIEKLREQIQNVE